MKDSGDFLKELRSEIEATQVRRASYVRAKLVFVVSMIGAGSISIVKAETTILLYLVPFVAYIFDLYVFSEDYGIRRAGAFIQESKETPREEILWERTVKENRDPFSKIAGIGSSMLVLIIAACLLYEEGITQSYCWWLFANVLILFGVWVYGGYIDKKLDNFRKELVKQNEKI